MIVRLFDWLVKKWLRSKGKYAQETKFHSVRHEYLFKNQFSPDSALHDLASIDTKSTALLTHISVAIAALVFSLSLFKEDRIATPFIYFELTLYIIVALFNMRCFRIMGQPHDLVADDINTYKQELHEECLIRRTYYIYCLRVVYILTFLLLIGIISKISELIFFVDKLCILN